MNLSKFRALIVNMIWESVWDSIRPIEILFRFPFEEYLKLEPENVLSRSEVESIVNQKYHYYEFI